MPEIDRQFLVLYRVSIFAHVLKILNHDAFCSRVAVPAAHAASFQSCQGQRCIIHLPATCQHHVASRPPTTSIICMHWSSTRKFPSTLIVMIGLICDHLVIPVGVGLQKGILEEFGLFTYNRSILTRRDPPQSVAWKSGSNWNPFMFKTSKRICTSNGILKHHS